MCCDEQGKGVGGRKKYKIGEICTITDKVPAAKV